MSYCTQAQMITWYSEEELIQRTDRPPYAGAISSTVLDEAIVTAGRRIDGYLRTVYTLPLAIEMVADSELPKICGDIARYELYANMTLDEKSEVQIRYDNAIRWLRDVQAKRVSLGEQDNSVAEMGDVVMVTGVSQINWSGY